MAKKALTKKEMENKKQLAFLLYMSGEDQKMIAEYTNVSERSVSAWVTAGKWKEKRSASTVTREELINKTLQAIGNMLDKALEEGDKNFSSISNALVQMANTIEKLDKKNNVVHQMATFQLFNDDLVIQMQSNKEVTPELIKLINRLQISFINRKLTNE